MEILWKKGASNYQKIIVSFLTFTSFITIFHFLFFTEFRPHDNYYKLSIYLSVATLLFITVWFSWIIKANKWQPHSEWYRSRFSKKIIAIFFAPIFLFFFLWVTIGYAIPFYITEALGTSSQITVNVTKKRTSSSRVSCEYSVYSDELERPFFQICVPKYVFESLPDSKMSVKLQIKSTILGMSIKNIDYENNR